MLDLVTLLLVPAAAVMLALPFGMHSRGPSKARHIRAVYLFHRTGEPIAMVAPDHAPPIAAEQLEPIIWTVRDFVETSVPKSQGYDVTSLRFDEEAFVAVRGPTSACAQSSAARTPRRSAEISCGSSGSSNVGTQAGCSPGKMPAASRRKPPTQCLP